MRFLTFFRPSKSSELSNEDRNRILVQKYSRRSLSLRLGNYVTKEEKEARKKKILAYKFTD